ncbi:MAG: radical SAM protein [Steroidobacteraceae bacterium]
MFDDDTFTDSSALARVEAIAAGMGKLGMTWSCNAKANVPYKTLKVMKDNGLRLLLVGYESGDDQILLNIKKGLRTDIARRFTEDCRKLGILIHGTFILGLPGETTETIEKTIRFAKEINPHTIQVSLAAPYPGTHPLPAGGRERLAAGERGRQSGQRSWRAAGGNQLSAPVQGTDIPQHGSVL